MKNNKCFYDMIDKNYFGFKELVDFFGQYRGEKYVDPQKAGYAADRMRTIQQLGKQVRRNFKKFGEVVERNFPDLVLDGCKNWQGNKGQGCPMEIKFELWMVFKNPKWKDKPQNISLSIGADDVLYIRVEIDDKHAKGNINIYKHQFHLLDIPLDHEGLVYRVVRKEGSEDYDCKSIEVIREMINDPKIPKIQVAKNINNVSDKDIHGTILEETVKAVEQLNYFYKYLMMLQESDKCEEIEIMNALYKDSIKFNNRFSSMLYESKNLILRGAPGTGKSYLAKEIAADIITNGELKDGKPIRYGELSEEQKKQVGFVQFHPNYDYSDFVEGLRPKKNDDGTINFELMDGIFQTFIKCARKNYEDSLKSLKTIEKESSVQESIVQFFSNIDLHKDVFRIMTGNKFIITDVDDYHINILIPANETCKKLSLKMHNLRKLLESDQDFMKIKDISAFFGKTYDQASSYYYALYKAIKDKQGMMKGNVVKQTIMKNYVFIIDEINRGEISKIFGELFYSIDPGYRGPDGEISTQYANMHDDPDEKLYIPENVYIIGTMNDIDRSVDSFDFAMRRRFRFVELKPSERLEMLDSLSSEVKQEAKDRMEKLNKAIISEQELNENYQIGAGYFLKLQSLSFDQLWTDYLQPLLQEYVRGMYDERAIMERFQKAYGYEALTDGDADESDQN